MEVCNSIVFLFLFVILLVEIWSCITLEKCDLKENIFSWAKNQVNPGIHDKILSKQWIETLVQT